MTGAVRRRRREPFEKIAISDTAACASLNLAARVAKNRGLDARGFASMDAEKLSQIARKGGRSVPDEKRSFSQNRQLASEAGRKGGHSSHGNRDSGQDKNQPIGTAKP
jgi:uncharacterized protein